MIDILLSTYNGSRYIGEQIDSIIRQTYKNWRLIIRDDSSSDNTVDIINKYVNDYSNQIILVDEASPNLGATKSFARLLDFVTSDYFMFADQDDIWKPYKIDICLKQMKEMEKQYGTGVPLMVCGDAECIDANHNIISKSFFESQKFIDTTHDDMKLLALNVVQGSSTLMNYSCLKLAKPIPNFVLHDQWLAVIVAHYGVISYLHQPLLEYRQHEGNVIGALDIGWKYFYHKILNFRKQMQTYSSFYRNLPFKVNLVEWIFYKIQFTYRRLLNS